MKGAMHKFKMREQQIRIRADPGLSGRIRIRKILTGSGSYRYFGNVMLYKQGKKYFKNRVFKHFQVNFSIFSGEKNQHQNILRNLIEFRC